jgi:hypothetical protein
MDLKERMDKFNKRWEITSNESYEEAFQNFKTRILNVFKGIDFKVSSNSRRQFCQYYAISEQARSSTSIGIIEFKLHTEEYEKEFYRLIEIILSLDIVKESTYENTKLKIIRGVENAIHFSTVNVAITNTSDNSIILYPKGEELLDEELVDLPLSFLNAKSATHFVDALKFYESNSPVKSANSLWRTLEEFLRYKLKNIKGLKFNKLELQNKLKEDGRDSHIRKVIDSTMTYFVDHYFNENSRHNDGDIDEAENEFLIYQVGVLLRYINKV